MVATSLHGHEELLQLLENECRGCSSTTQSVEVNVSQKEAGDVDPQSNDQVVLEECYEDQKVHKNLKGDIS